MIGTRELRKGDDFVPDFVSHLVEEQADLRVVCSVVFVECLHGLWDVIGF